MQQEVQRSFTKIVDAEIMNDRCKIFDRGRIIPVVQRPSAPIPQSTNNGTTEWAITDQWLRIAI